MSSPIRFDSKTNEPYIPLPEPHSNIRLTPPRMSDAPALVELFAKPEIYKFLLGPPNPYLLSHGESWLKEHVDTYDAAKAQIDDMSGPGLGRLFGNTPLRIIREVQEDGSELFLGDVGIGRCLYEQVTDDAEREKLTADNDAKPLGDPTIIWSFGDYLRPSHHGRGIMTLAIRTLLETWAIPYMGVRQVRTYVCHTNPASKRVFEKLGFKLAGSWEGVLPPDDKRDEAVGLWAFDYTVVD